jgi:hypothetical protein
VGIETRRPHEPHHQPPKLKNGDTPHLLEKGDGPRCALDDALRWGKLMVARGEKDFCAEPNGIRD